MTLSTSLVSSSGVALVFRALRVPARLSRAPRCSDDPSALTSDLPLPSSLCASLFWEHRCSPRSPASSGHSDVLPLPVSRGRLPADPKGSGLACASARGGAGLPAWEGSPSMSAALWTRSYHLSSGRPGKPAMRLPQTTCEPQTPASPWGLNPVKSEGQGRLSTPSPHLQLGQRDRACQQPPGKQVWMGSGFKSDHQT